MRNFFAALKSKHKNELVRITKYREKSNIETESLTSKPEVSTVNTGIYHNDDYNKNLKYAESKLAVSQLSDRLEQESRRYIHALNLEI